MKILGGVALDSKEGIMAVGLFLGTGALVAATVISTKTRSRIAAGAIAVATLSFQMFHLLEHSFQVYFWAKEPNDTWLSTVALQTAHGLNQYCSLIMPTGTDRQFKVGLEVLHLLGNTIFLCGIIALGMVMRRGSASEEFGHTSYGTSIRKAQFWETIHVVEHVVLTFTIVLTGRARGLSSLGGFVDGAPVLAWRVWFHFILHCISTVYLVRSMWQYWNVYHRVPRTNHLVAVH